MGTNFAIYALSFVVHGEITVISPKRVTNHGQSCGNCTWTGHIKPEPLVTGKRNPGHSAMRLDWQSYYLRDSRINATCVWLTLTRQLQALLDKEGFAAA